MIQHSTLASFTLLIALCVAAAGCTATARLSSEENVARDIFNASHDHGALVTLDNGDTETCFDIALRSDTTEVMRVVRGIRHSIPISAASRAGVKRAQVANPPDKSGKNLETRTDSVVYFGEELVRHSVPTDRIVSIEVATPNPKSVIAYGVSGFVIGALIGGMGPPAQICSTWWGVSSCDDYQSLAMLRDGAVGGILGWVVGTVVGSKHTTVYRR